MNKYIKHGKEVYITHVEVLNPEWFNRQDSDFGCTSIAHHYRNKYYFVTSNRVLNAPRRYTARVADISTGSVECLSDFMEFSRGNDALVFIGHHLKALEVKCVD